MPGSDPTPSTRHQVTAHYQAVGGAVNTSTTPEVQYIYTEMASGANNSRLTEIVYPDGYTVDYNYGGGLDSSISRLTLLSDDTGTLETTDLTVTDKGLTS